MKNDISIFERIVQNRLARLEIESETAEERFRGILLAKQALTANNWPPEVLDFCRKHRLEPELKLAVQLVEKHFRNARHVVEMNGDPENDSEWIVVRFDARGTVESVLDDYSCCKKEWVQLSSQSGLFLIRFSYNII